MTEPTTQNHPETSPDNDGETSDVGTLEGFVPPARATRARIRRINMATGAWEDAPVFLDGVQTAIVPVGNANPNLQILDPVPSVYRMTWQDDKGTCLGYSRTWRIQEQAGGVSNTPRMWPLPVTERNNVGAPSRSALTPDETVRLLDGLARVVTETARPLIMQIEAFHEGALARERAFHEQQRRVDEANFQRTLVRDREFMGAMREVHERPRDQRIAQLEQELAALRADDQEDDAAQAGNAWDLAGKVLENAPELIRTVAQEVRRGGAAAEAAEAAAEALAE